MRDAFGVVGLAAAALAVTSLVGYAQTNVDPGTAGSRASRQLGPGSVMTSEGGTTVFRGAPGVVAHAPETSVSGSPEGFAPTNPAGASAITVFRGAPGGASLRAGSLGASSPTTPPGPGAAAGR